MSERVPQPVAGLTLPSSEHTLKACKKNLQKYKQQQDKDKTITVPSFKKVVYNKNV